MFSLSARMLGSSATFYSRHGSYFFDIVQKPIQSAIVNVRDLSTKQYNINDRHQKRRDEEEQNQTVVLTKSDIPQSPWKMRFLVMLVREAWLPDALTQMKFTPKVRGADIARILKRGAILAKLRFDAIPEELRVKEVMVTKGMAIKRQRIMGRGRTGVGYKRKSHIRMIIEKIDFPKFIEKLKSYNQKQKWLKRQQLVEDIKKNLKKSIAV